MYEVILLLQNWAGQNKLISYVSNRSENFIHSTQGLKTFGFGQVENIKQIDFSKA